MGTFITTAVNATIASFIPSAPGVMLTNKDRVDIMDKNRALNKLILIPNTLNSKNIVKSMIATLIKDIKLVIAIIFLLDFIKCQPLITFINLLTKGHFVSLTVGEKNTIPSKNKKTNKKIAKMRILKNP